MRYGILLFLFLLSPLGFSQNLVPNNSFEIYSACPSVPGSIGLASGWQSPTLGSPDFFHSCSSSFGIPNNGFGVQASKTGQAYGGILVSGSSSGMGAMDEREYVQIQLSDSLVAGQFYCVEFYVSLADSSEFAIDRLGAYLSPNAVNMSTTGALPLVPQVVSPAGVFLSNSFFWISVSEHYLASGGERYLTIGNFNDVLTTDTVQVRPALGNFPMAYYYLEDVSVHACDTTVVVSNEPQFSNVFTPNEDGINDQWKLSRIPAGSVLTIYNRWGLPVLEAGKQFPLLSEYKWDGKAATGDACVAGVYYYVLLTPEKSYTGFVQLIR